MLINLYIFEGLIYILYLKKNIARLIMDIIEFFIKNIPWHVKIEIFQF
jgi:hypothetical protein